MQDAFPNNVTIGEKYGPAMEITNEAEARAYFHRCVQHTMGFGKSREEAEKIERANLGYYAGYYDSQTSQRVLALFGAAHPIFGTQTPSTSEALRAGQMMAKEAGAPQ